MKQYILLDDRDMSKLNNNDEVKFFIHGEIIYLCSEKYFKEQRGAENEKDNL